MISLGGELKLGKGVKGYRLQVRQELERESKIYDEGVALESSLNDPTSFASKVLMRLSSFQTHEPAATETQDAPRSRE